MGSGDGVPEPAQQSDAALVQKALRNFSVLRRECAEERGRRRRLREKQPPEDNTRRQVRLRRQLAGWGPDVARESDNVRVLRATGSLPRALEVFGVTRNREAGRTGAGSVIDDTARQTAAQVLRKHQQRKHAAGSDERKAWEEGKRRGAAPPRPAAVILDTAQHRLRCVGWCLSKEDNRSRSVWSPCRQVRETRRRAAAGSPASPGGGLTRMMSTLGCPDSPDRRPHDLKGPDDLEEDDTNLGYTYKDRGPRVVDPLKHQEYLLELERREKGREEVDDDGDDVFSAWTPAYRMWKPSPDPPPPSCAEVAKTVRGQLRALIDDSARRVALYRQGASAPVPPPRPNTGQLSATGGGHNADTPTVSGSVASPVSPRGAEPSIALTPEASGALVCATASQPQSPADALFQLTQVGSGDIPPAVASPRSAVRPPTLPVPPGAMQPRLPLLRVVEVSAEGLVEEADKRTTREAGRAKVHAPAPPETPRDAEDRRPHTSRTERTAREPVPPKRPQTSRPSATTAETEDEEALRLMTEIGPRRRTLGYRPQRPQSSVRPRQRGIEFPLFKQDVASNKNHYLSLAGAEVARYGKERSRVAERKRDELCVSLRQTWQAALASMVRAVASGLERVLAAERRETQRRYYDTFEAQVREHYGGVLTRGAQAVLVELKHFFYSEEVSIDAPRFETLLDAVTGPQFLVDDTVSVLFSVKHIFRVTDDRFADFLRDRMRGVVSGKDEFLAQKLLPAAGSTTQPLQWVVRELPLHVIGPLTLAWSLQTQGSTDGDAAEIRTEEMTDWLLRLGAVRVAEVLPTLQPEALSGGVAKWVSSDPRADELRRQLLQVKDRKGGDQSEVKQRELWLSRVRQRAEKHSPRRQIRPEWTQVADGSGPAAPSVVHPATQSGGPLPPRPLQQLRSAGSRGSRMVMRTVSRTGSRSRWQPKALGDILT